MGPVINEAPGLNMNYTEGQGQSTKFFSSAIAKGDLRKPHGIKKDSARIRRLRPGQNQGIHAVGAGLEQSPSGLLAGGPGGVDIVDEQDPTPFHRGLVPDPEGTGHIPVTGLDMGTGLGWGVTTPFHGGEINGPGGILTIFLPEKIRKAANQKIGLVKSPFPQFFHVQGNRHDHLFFPEMGFMGMEKGFFKGTDR